MDLFILGDFQHHGVGFYLHIGAADHFGKALSVFGAGQLLFKVMEAETVVDALVEDAAQFFIPLQNQHFFCAAGVAFVGGGQTGGASADDHQIIHYRFPPTLVSPVMM